MPHAMGEGGHRGRQHAIIMAAARMSAASVVLVGTMTTAAHHVCFGATRPTASAPQRAMRSNHGRLVAIGDSITFGYNLGNNAAPSPRAFPALVSNQLHWQAVNLGVPGWTSRDVLQHLGTSRFKTALSQANLVVLDIGSNDLLQAAQPLLLRYRASINAKTRTPLVVTPANQARLTHAVQQFAQNEAAIITQIRRQSAAPIVLVNLYDPFPDTNPLHNASESAIAGANTVIATAAAASQSLFADVYLPFNHRQTRYVQVKTLDIHPTAAGQVVIANEVSAALNRPLWHSPNDYAVAPKGVLVRNQPSVSGTAIAWLHANQGALVTGNHQGWYGVVTPAGQSGYVPGKSVTLLLRPWNDVSFQSIRAQVSELQWQVGQTGASRQIGTLGQSSHFPGFVWQGLDYAPVTALASVANHRATWQNASRQVDITAKSVATGQALTDVASRVASGAASSTLTASGAIAPRSWPTVTAVVTGRVSTTSLVTSGIAVQYNGEFVRLGGQAVRVDGQIYVPVDAVWQAMGGLVETRHPTVVHPPAGDAVTGRGTPVLRLTGPSGS